jgi:hypothetical protein
MSKQTSVNWFDEQIQEKVIAQDTVARKMIIEISMDDYMDIKRQSQVLFEKQIIDAYLHGVFNRRKRGASKYYQENYEQ